MKEDEMRFYFDKASLGGDWTSFYTGTGSRSGKTQRAKDLLDQIKKNKWAHYEPPPKPNPEHKDTDFVLVYCIYCKEYVHDKACKLVQARSVCERCIEEIRHQPEGGPPFIRRYK